VQPGKLAKGRSRRGGEGPGPRRTRRRSLETSRRWGAAATATDGELKGWFQIAVACVLTLQHLKASSWCRLRRLQGARVTPQ
jgi:hypothetical protein